VNEAYLKRALKDALRVALPGCVVVRHEDKFTAGVPDLSVTWAGVTSWIEVKYERKGRLAKLTALQEKALQDLAMAGAPAYALTYAERGKDRVAHLSRLLNRTSSVDVVLFFDHKAVSEAIRDEHLRRNGTAV